MASTMTAPGPTRGDWRPEPMSQRIVVRCYTRYADAKRAVGQLRGVARIPDSRISVMGRGISHRPALTGERAFRLGGALGAIVNAATALLLWSLGGLDSGFSWPGALFAGAALGGVTGALVAVAAWRVSRETGALPETSNVDVSRYDVLVENGDVEKARKLLGD